MDVLDRLQQLYTLGEDIRIVFVKYGGKDERQVKSMIDDLIWRGDFFMYRQVVFTEERNYYIKKARSEGIDVDWGTLRHEEQIVAIDEADLPWSVEETEEWYARWCEWRLNVRNRLFYVRYQGSIEQYIHQRHMKDDPQHYVVYRPICTVSDGCECCCDDSAEMAMTRNLLPKYLFHHFARQTFCHVKQGIQAMLADKKCLGQGQRRWPVPSEETAPCSTTSRELVQLHGQRQQFSREPATRNRDNTDNLDDIIQLYEGASWVQHLRT